ncbi:MAG: DUF2088 domain-containing protein [Anaerolineae bacterium]|nr:DUF2088 domain-containing protein [Anaerolineae bacterium]
MTIGMGSVDRYLTEDDVRQVVGQAAASLNADGQRVLVIIPDGTRSMPMPLMFRVLNETLGPRVRALDYLVALGTHIAMDDAHLSRLVGAPVVNGQVGRSHIFNHRWDQPDTFIQLGEIPADEIGALTDGRLVQSVPVQLNRLILDYDVLLICGPVFPHEVVGFSGGNKYFFPGIAGPDIINFTHWLGAVITNYNIIGAGYTPVRAVIDRAAQMIPRPRACLALVVTYSGLAGLYFGTPEEAWQAASALSAQKHIIYVERPYKRVLSVMPTLYDDLWTAAKGMYKVEPAVADDGEVIIYGPHVSEVSYTHGRLIDEVGYHVRDYFLKQWDRFKGYPGGVLAHSTHVKGLGEYDAGRHVETPRVQVTLATHIPQERCQRINLGYRDPDAVRVDEWLADDDPDTLVIPKAGEMLYRLKEGA